MRRLKRRDSTTRYFGWTTGFGLLAILIAVPGTVQAQTVAVPMFSGKTKKMQASAQAKIIETLEKKGVKPVLQKQYLEAARKNGIQPKKMLMPWAVRKLSQQMNLHGVVTGNGSQEKGMLVLRIQLMDPDGKVILNKTLRTKKPVLADGPIAGLATLIVKKLGSRSTIPPSSAQKGSKTEIIDVAGPLLRPRKSSTSTSNVPKSTGKKTEWKKQKKDVIGSVPDVLISAGLSMNVRRGLHPKHSSGMYPGLRLDTRFFLGSFRDIPVIKDIGMGGMYNVTFGLDYSGEAEQNDSNTDQHQWQGELIYRLAFNQVRMAPAILFRLGYGSTSCLIRSDNPRALSAGYNYPYGALDIHLMLHRPKLRLLVSAGYLFLVSGFADISGPGTGFTVKAGLELALAGSIHIGLGYDLFQFVGMKIEETGVEVSDVYQGFFIRIGWNYH